MLRTILFALAIMLLQIPAANAEIRISGDRGGQIGRYEQRFAGYRDSGQDVYVDGDCLSACTLLLGFIPPNRIHMGRSGRFGFHAAWMPDDDGRPVTSKLGTDELWSRYPSSVRKWIAARGGLTRRMIFLTASQYAKLYGKKTPAQHRTKVRTAANARR